MPFTFSHPAYIVPLKYIAPKRFSLTGLVLGSMAPDFEYFISLEPYVTIGHTMSGLFIQAIPLSILFAYVFHYIVKEPLALHLPTNMDLNGRAYHLVKKWKLTTVKDWLVFILSVVTGFISHIVIDAFTHNGGYAVTRLPFLEVGVLFDIPVYKLLQYGLSLIGLLITFIMILTELSRSKPLRNKAPAVSTKQRVQYWMGAVIASGIVTCLKLVVSTSDNAIGIIVVAPISGMLLGIVVVSFITQLKKRNAA